MYYLIITVLLGSAQPSFAGIFEDEHSCAKNATVYMEALKSMNDELKVLAVCMKAKIDQPSKPSKQTGV